MKFWPQKIGKIEPFHILKLAELKILTSFKTQNCSKLQFLTLKFGQIWQFYTLGRETSDLGHFINQNENLDHLKGVRVFRKWNFGAKNFC